jgi:hypothetical protein
MHLMNREFVDYVCASIQHQHAQYRHGTGSPEFLATYEAMASTFDRLSSEDRIEALKIALVAVHEMACSGTSSDSTEPPQ